MECSEIEFMKQITWQAVAVLGFLVVFALGLTHLITRD